MGHPGSNKKVLMRTFIDDVLEGLAVFEDLDKYIEIWLAYY